MDKTTSSFDLKDEDVIEALNSSYNIKAQIDLLDNLQMNDI
jgi:hypothetical protein